jgi:hypothetical protein
VPTGIIPYISKNYLLIGFDRMQNQTHGRSRTQGRNGVRGGRGYSKQGLRSHDKQSSSAEIFEVPRLRYGTSSNFEEFKRKLQVQLERDFKQLASFLRTNVYYVPPAIEEGVQFSAEDLSPENDPFGFARRAVDQEIGMRLKKIAKIVSSGL